MSIIRHGEDSIVMLVQIFVLACYHPQAKMDCPEPYSAPVISRHGP